MNIKKDIEDFNEKVSGFRGDKAKRSITKFYEENKYVCGVPSKSMLFPIQEVEPFLENTFNDRGGSERTFTERCTLEDINLFMSGLYNIPKPGDFDVIHCFGLFKMNKYEGLIYSDLKEGITYTRRKQIKNDFFRKFYGDVVDFKTIDFEGASATLFFVAEMDKIIEKYQHLAYDYVMIMAGALIQNAYINAQAMGLRKCALGCYSKKAVIDYFLKGDKKYVCLTSLIVGR